MWPLRRTTWFAIPENLSFTEAAAAAEVFFTAYYNLFMQAGIKAADVLLLHGGGSGVGTAAIQLGSSIGAKVIITAGSEDKIKRALDLGASAGINYKEEDFAGRVMDITQRQGRGYHSRLDWGALSAQAPGDPQNRGAACHHWFDGRERGRNKPCPGCLTKRLKVIGSVLRSQSKEEKAAIARGFTDTVLPLLKSGRVKPIIDRIFPIREVEDAHRYLGKGEHFGKIVLTWESF